jgi:chromosome segregation ATPase
MQRLRREVDDLRERLPRLEQQVGRRFSEVEERIQRSAGEMGERIEQVEAQQRALRRASLRQEVRGARLFILGAVLSAVANLV